MSSPSRYTGCTKSQDPCLNFERIYLEYYYRYNGKIKIYSRFGYGKSIPLGFSSISIVILNIYTFKVQTVNRTFEAPCKSAITLVFERSLNKLLLWNVSSVSMLLL